MRALILAAGRGSRMKNLTSERPKCLVELNGKPLLLRQLDAIRAAGISDIGIVTGYKREMLSQYGLAEFHNPRWAETQMVASLACASEWLADSPCIVSYSDIFYEAAAVRSLMDCAADIAITYDPNWLELWTKRFGDPLSDAETFRLNPDGTLAEIGNNPANVGEIQGQYMGLLRFTPSGWEQLVNLHASFPQIQQDRMHLTGTLQMLLEEHSIEIAAVPYTLEWGEVDSIEDLAAYEEH